MRKLVGLALAGSLIIGCATAQPQSRAVTALGRPAFEPELEQPSSVERPDPVSCIPDTCSSPANCEAAAKGAEKWAAEYSAGQTTNVGLALAYGQCATGYRRWAEYWKAITK